MTAMRLVAVTACPTGVAHTVMAAEALRRQAEIMGHRLEVETQGADGVRHPLSPETIAAADAVIIAADIYVDPSRFAGKPIHATSTAQAIRHTAAVVEAALAAAAETAKTAETGGASAVEPEPPAGPGPGPVKRLVPVTSCPTGIAHTSLAAQGLPKAAGELAAADAVSVAADTKVDLSRFGGKPIYQTGTKEALKHGQAVVRQALASSTIVPGDGSTTSGPAPGASPAAEGERPRPGRHLKDVYQHLMTGVSYMLPLIVAGGLLIAISFALDINANQPALAHTLAGRMNQVGGAAFALSCRCWPATSPTPSPTGPASPPASSAGTWRCRSTPASWAPSWPGSSPGTSPGSWPGRSSPRPPWPGSSRC